jgi:hypothetical protein
MLILAFPSLRQQLAQAPQLQSASAAVAFVRAPKCASISWAAPTLILENGRPFPGRYPTLALRRTGWVVGTENIEVPSQPMKDRVFSLAGKPEVRWSPPKGESGLYPYLALPDESDRLELLWGGVEASDSAKPLVAQKVNAVWSAEILADGSMSQPMVLYRASAVDWDAITPSRIVKATRGRLVTMFTANGSPWHHGVLARYANGRWDAHDIELPVSPAYVSVGTIGDTIVAAIVGSAPDGTGGNNAVWIMSSPDFGKTWRTPQLVSTPGTGEAHYPSVAVAGGAAHVFWTQVGSDGSLSLRHVAYHPLSPPGPVAVLPVHRRMWSLRTEVTQCGIHVMAVDASPSPAGSGAFYALWDDRWDNVSHVLTDYWIEGLDFASDANGALHLVFSATPFSQRRDSVPKMLMTQSERR